MFKTECVTEQKKMWTFASIFSLSQIFVAIISFARSDIDDLTAAKLFIECCHKALDGGLPSIPIPDHNPLVIRNVTYNSTTVLYDFTISMTNNILYNLLDYNFTKLDATSYSSLNKVNYDYDLYWPILNFTGEYDFTFASDQVNGTYNIVLHHVDWTGIFNLTKPGQEGVKEHLDEFTLASAVQDVEVHVTENVDNLVTEEALKLAISDLFNNLPASVADILKDSRFNEFWIDHPERIQAIIDNCVS